MRVAYAALLLLLFTAACVSAKPQTSISKPPAIPTQPRTTQPAAKPAPQAPGKVSPPAAKTPVAPALDLNTLEAQLKDTRAIGFFTKITLKNQIDDLLDKFRDHHLGKATPTMTELRRSFDLLMMKVLSLLQDADQQLASAIVSSREAIWRLLANPKTFATLQNQTREDP